MKIYLDQNFEITDEAGAVLVKVIPEDGSPPYFEVPTKEEPTDEEPAKEPDDD